MNKRESWLRQDNKLDVTLFDDVGRYGGDSIPPIVRGAEQRRAALLHQGGLDQVQDFIWISAEEKGRTGRMHGDIFCLFRAKNSKYVLTHFESDWCYYPVWTVEKCLIFPSLRDAVKEIEKDPGVYFYFLTETKPLILPSWRPETHQDISKYLDEVGPVVSELMILWSGNNALALLPLELVFELITSFVSLID